MLFDIFVSCSLVNILFFSFQNDYDDYDDDDAQFTHSNYYCCCCSEFINISNALIIHIGMVFFFKIEIGLEFFENWSCLQRDKSMTKWS